MTCFVHWLVKVTPTNAVWVPRELWGGTLMLDGTGLRTVLVRVVFRTVLMIVIMVAAVKVELTPLSDQVYTTGPRRGFKTVQLGTQLAFEF